MICTSESARVRNAVLGCSLENDRMILVRFQVKPLNITVVQNYAPATNSEEAEVEWFYEDLQHLLEIIPKKKKKKEVPSSWETGMQKQEVVTWL